MKYIVESDEINKVSKYKFFNQSNGIEFEIFKSSDSQALKVNTLGNLVSHDVINLAIKMVSQKDNKRGNLVLDRLAQSIVKIVHDNKDSIDNDKTIDYLLSVASWIEDCDGYYKNVGIEINYNNDVLKIVQDALQAGLIYE